MALTVAVTGPTGEIGKPFIDLLDRTKEVGRIIGMARRPFDPAARGWKKVEYRQGDVLDRDAIDALVDGVDVVVHLAFVIMDAAHGEDVNVTGSRTVFSATADAGIGRLVYASSVAAYGFHPENPSPLTEDVPPRGTDAFPYSAQKARLEAILAEELRGALTEAWVLRPCIVAGPQAPLLVDQIPYVRWGEQLPSAVRALFDVVPVLKPVLPDPGVPFQLVHHDDVATALRAAVLGRGAPGVYNLAGPGSLTMRDVADALGYYSVPVPELVVDAAAEIVTRLPFLPGEASWITAFREPVLMDCAKARRELGWRPKHDAAQTLAAMVAGARADLRPELR
jgi:nucleoside-diphosphate-sugar epimerase